MAEYRWWRRVAGAGALACAVVAAAGCGGGGGDKSTSSAAAGDGTDTSATTDTTSGGGGGKTFPLLKVTWAPPDYMDPALAYTVNAWELMQNIYIGLVTYKHVNGPDGAIIIPGLAQALPKVTNGGKTYSFTLRKGLKYSDGTAIKASDFTYTIKRLFLLDSPGVGFFTGIVGTDQFSKTKKGDISGIKTDDAAGTIDVTLSAPQGDFENILATEFATLVPAGTPNKDQSTNPIPSTGPYKLDAYTPNRSFKITRNPNYTAIAGVPKGNPDEVDGKILEDDAASLQTVLSGEADYDQHTIPTDRLDEIQQKYADQLKFYTSANTFYLFLNHRQPPFDKLQVRQAVNYAIDRNAMVTIFGGLGQATQNFLPPTYPAYKKISFYKYDLAKAKSLIKAAGATGQQVTVWGNDSDLASKSMQYVADQLNKIGLKAKVKLVARAVYWQTVGNQATKAQMGWADWFQDYPHPLDWFDVMMNGDRITQIHNNNYGNVDVKAVNAKIAALKKEPTQTDAVNAQWAQIDYDLVVKDAAMAPFLNQEATDFFGSDIDVANCYVNHVLFAWDFAAICKK